MEPIFTVRQLIQSIGQAVVIFLVAIRVIGYESLSIETMWGPAIDSVLGALMLLGFARVGPAPPNVEVKVIEKKVVEIPMGSLGGRPGGLGPPGSSER